MYLVNFKFEMIMHKISIIFILLYFIVITVVLCKIKYKKYVYNLLLIFLILIHYNFNILFNQNYITFIDVGQGDCALIHLNNKNILIDTGGNKSKNVANDITTYLKSEGISKLDYIVLTHGDYDHMGESINLIKNFNVGKVILNCGETNDLEKNLINFLNRKGLAYYSCIKQLNIDNYKFEFLNTKKYDNENDNSSVIYFKYNNYKFLFMGDASVEKEEDILKKYHLQNIDFLKVGHHGSRTSSSKYFINNINPKYSIISVGKNNRYKHPNDSVLDNLSNSIIYRTDINGSIKLKLTENGYKIKTCNP